ncbi:MAG TPA: transglutaminase family protein [Acidimicrobiales bacterium]|nr:transglutaminase family protein [Acidimicrobiales bacterium]
MSWRLGIRHTSAYSYAHDVVTSYNEVRVTPLTTGGQVTVEARIEVTPSARPVSYWDYWGTLVHAFDIHVPHRELVVVGSSIVETAAAHPTDRPTISWAELDDAAVGEAYFEYLASTAVDQGLDAIGTTLRKEASTPHEALELVGDWVRAALVYERGATSVSTSAAEAWRSGRGVCQDFVHLASALLRSMGIPARYASGYFHPQADAPIGETVHGESHAWCEAWTGAWWPFDPTNAVAVGERHVLVARGRDYGDVPPLKGIFSGAPSTTPAVSVELTRHA